VADRHELAVADRHARDDAVGRVEQVDAPVGERQLATVGTFATILVALVRIIAAIAVAVAFVLADRRTGADGHCNDHGPTHGRTHPPVSHLVSSRLADLSDASLFWATVLRRRLSSTGVARVIPVQANTRPSTCPPRNRSCLRRPHRGRIYGAAATQG
jgi:hypothetical protein